MHFVFYDDSRLLGRKVLGAGYMYMSRSDGGGTGVVVAILTSFYACSVSTRDSTVV